MDTTNEKTSSKSLRSLLEALELELKFAGANYPDGLESAVQKLLASVKSDSFNLSWRLLSPPDPKVEYSSTYLENIEAKMRQIPEDAFSVRLSRTCGHCGIEKPLIGACGFKGNNVREALGMLETVKEL